MRAVSTVASGLRHSAVAIAEALLVAAIIAGLLLALSPVYQPADFLAGTESAQAGGRVSVTLSLASASAAAVSTSSSSVSFVATRSSSTDEVLWVTNRCYDAAGAEVSRVDQPVVWGLSSSLEGIAGPYEPAGERCTAYATWKPWTNKPIRGAIVDY